jgi:hypothetical protein
MTAAADEHLVGAWTSGSPSELAEGLNNFLEPYGKAGATVGDYLKPSHTVVEFFDWLYSTDHISLTYGLSYNGTPLENLSPGTKGIVLLILYLAMDKKDTRPLLIDQPRQRIYLQPVGELLPKSQAPASNPSHHAQPQPSREHGCRAGHCCTVREGKRRLALIFVFRRRLGRLQRYAKYAATGLSDP